jgi:hypothetical protein
MKFMLSTYTILLIEKWWLKFAISDLDIRNMEYK